MWIHLKPNADKKKCAKIVANLKAHVDAVCPPDMRDEEDEVWAGVGFGPNFFTQVRQISACVLFIFRQTSDLESICQSLRALLVKPGTGMN